MKHRWWLGLVLAVISVLSPGCDASNTSGVRDYDTEELQKFLDKKDVRRAPEALTQDEWRQVIEAVAEALATATDEDAVSLAIILIYDIAAAVDAGVVDPQETADLADAVVNRSLSCQEKREPRIFVTSLDCKHSAFHAASLFMDILSTSTREHLVTQTTDDEVSLGFAFSTYALEELWRDEEGLATDTALAPDALLDKIAAYCRDASTSVHEATNVNDRAIATLAAMPHPRAAAELDRYFLSRMDNPFLGRAFREIAWRYVRFGEPAMVDILIRAIESGDSEHARDAMKSFEVLSANADLHDDGIRRLATATARMYPAYQNIAGFPVERRLAQIGVGRTDLADRIVAQARPNGPIQHDRLAALLRVLCGEAAYDEADFD